MDALNISKYFLSKINREDFEELGEGISHLKLQKILFYTQKVFYSTYKEPIFKDEIEAWKHGPVISKVYQEFKEFDGNNIDIFKIEDKINQKEQISADTLFVIDFIWDKYNQYDAWALRDKTHREEEWINNYIEGMNNTISLKELYSEDLKKEFKEYKAFFDGL